MKLALGPLGYYWPKERMQAFYREVESWPLDIVYLGEVVCAKRRSFGLRDWLEAADRLAAAGKEVVLSTLALVEAASELAMLERICRNGRYRIEANDMAAVQALSGETPFVVGPHVNCYNPMALDLLVELGAFRWVSPVEMSAESLQAMRDEHPEGVEIEVLAYGRLPLAFSARCFTARDAGLAKDRCGFRCGDFPEGLPLSTQEGSALFTVNGVQLQSALPCNLLADFPSLQARGVDVLRVMPQQQGTADIVSAFRGVIDGQSKVPEACDALRPLSPEGYCNGYWHGEPGMLWAPTPRA
ncbi:U32 family peptidase [Acidihalobacter aeolianus]|uniref:Ubiquinone biosynthesis protein UbiV n=1 Tax=Acidihalobacter aeolianus TaxID=2792603 RepID=A0A1D8K905_9GAMM|nr:U32 family peptidase [Acidihalobacter aeolianus]AOV17411.1 U32 family peptidase [Acidihalobacter aeolianus]